MRGRFWFAVVSLGVAFALLVPSVAPLSGSMDAFAADLANGTFRPFGSPDQGRVGASDFGTSLGGLTGNSIGNFLPGASDLPEEWAMDRDGRAGAVTVDHVFNPSLGAMKRLKVYDSVDENGTTLAASDTRLRRVEQDRGLAYDTVFTGRFEVQLRPGEPVPIFSPHPKAIVQGATISERISGSFSILKDATDTYYVLSDHAGIVTLNVTYRADSAYYFFDGATGFRTGDYAPSVRPVVSPQLREDAQVVLARAGVRDQADVAHVVTSLAAYFRAFEEGDLPDPAEVESLYLALGAGGTGCCRHRAFAYMITAQAVGIPTRVVVNEAHAFVEVMLPTGAWHQINLGGCGTYRSNNPNQYPSLFQQAADPRTEANPDEGRPTVLLPSVTDITESPPRILKGERYFVNGTVLGLDGLPVEGARIDVYLNETKEAPGRLSGAGTTDASGRYSVEARVPKDLPARSYQLVARSTEGRSGEMRFEESWSDPPVDVFSPTQFETKLAQAAVGVPALIPARLIDIDGQPVPGAEVAWSAGGLSGEATTDSLGRFVVNVTFPTIGDQVVALSYAGSEHHGAATGEIPVEVRTGAILLPPEPPTLARGEPGFVRGTVALAGSNVAGREVQLVLGGFRSDGQLILTALTDARGAFAVPVRPEPGTPAGAYAARVIVPSFDMEATTGIRVAIQPKLLVDAPGRIVADDNWIVEAQLASDTGEPLAQSLVELTVDGERTTARKLLTNRTGFARFEIPAGSMADGERVLRLTFPGDPSHVAASEEIRVEVVAARSLTVPLPLVAAAIALALLAGLGVYAFGPDGAGRRLVHTALAGALLPARRRLRLEFPDHPEGVPPAYEPGGEARVRIRVTRPDGRATSARLRLALDGGGTADARAGPDGVAETTLPLGDASRVARLHARGRGLSRLTTPPARADVLVTGYRAAVEAAFVELRAAARLDDSATAGDLVRALDARLTPEQRIALERAARLFDVADYSEQPVGLDDYHEFARVRLSLHRALEGPAAGA